MRRRYSLAVVDKIMKIFNFAPICSIDDYCKTIDNFTSSGIVEKCKLGFVIHDLNGDGRICPNDVFSIVSKNSEFAYLGFFDYTLLMEELEKKKPSEIRPPGYMLKDLNTAFMEIWKVKQVEHRKMEEEAEKRFGHTISYTPSKGAKPNLPTTKSGHSHSVAKMRGNTKKDMFSPNRSTNRKGSVGSRFGKGSPMSHALESAQDDKETIDLDEELLGKISKRNKQKTRVEAQTQKTTLESVDIERLKTRTLQDEELLDMRKDIEEKVAMKRKVKEFLEKTYKRNKDTVIAARKNDSTK